jgi:chemotaxis-related protein WspD
LHKRITMSEVSLTMEQSCWSRIGVWGDGTCTELPRVSHCHNCEVYAAGGRRLLDRSATADDVEAWTEALAVEKAASEATTTPHLVFRIGQVWLSFPATSLREITEPKAIRSVPHRPREVLLGMVNVRGELHPCVSLHMLFGEEATVPAPRTACFLVAHRPDGDWVFPVDQVEGMHDVSGSDIEPLPVTLTNVDVVYTNGLFHAGKKTVAIIDEEMLFGALIRRIS